VSDSSRFEGTASHPSLGADAWTGQLVVSPWTLRFESPEVQLEIAWDKTEVRLGEKGDDGVYFLSPDAPDWVIRSAGREILEHRVFKQHGSVRHQVREQREREEGWRRLRLAVGFLGVFAVLWALLYVSTGWMVRQLVQRIPASFEKGLGDEMMAELRQECAFADETETAGRLRGLVDRLARAQPAGGLKFQVHVLEEPVPNALAAPGGHILVTTGMLDMGSSSEEVAGVLAHEMAHLRARHSLHKLLNGLGARLVVKLFVGGQRGLLRTVAQSSSLMIQQGFSRQFEQEADDRAWACLVAAKVDPRGLTSFLRKIEAEEARDRRLMQKLGMVEVRAFSSHPATAERIRRLEARWRELKVKSGFVKLEPLGPRQP
jgi:Zn-dependent protease with chaperone function